MSLIKVRFLKKARAMAYFSDEELIDAIRHVFLVTDDHGLN